jgi:lysozyme
MNLDSLIAALKADEGLRLKPYLDTAIPPRYTIGYGRNLFDVGISDQEAHDMLVRDTIKAQSDAADLIPNWLALDDVRQNVCANMCFNLGKAGLAKFTKFLAAVNEKRFDDAAVEMFHSKWYSQVKGRAERLAQEMLTGSVT